MDGVVPATPPAKRIKRSRLPKAKVMAMAEAGLSTYQIAKVVDCNQSTIHRFLNKIAPEIKAVQRLKDNRADVLATLQAKNLIVQDKLLDKLDDDGLLAALTPQQLTGVVFALNSQHGTLFDKERLERGQSSANISLVSRMIDGQIGTLYKPTDNTGIVDEAPQQGAVGTGDAIDGPVMQPGIDDTQTGGVGGKAH